MRINLLANGEPLRFADGNKPDIFEFNERDIPFIEKAVTRLKRHRKLYSATVMAGAFLLHATDAFAAETGISGGMNIIKLMQQGAFWVGMGVTIWGLIEMGLDAPNWRGRVFKGVLLYVGVLLVPLIFLELKGALQVDVWNQMENTPVNTPTEVPTEVPVNGGNS